MNNHLIKIDNTRRKTADF